MNNSASLRRQGFGELAHTNAQDLSFRIFGSTPDANRDSQAGPGILSPSYASAISSPFNSSMSSFQSPPTSWDTTAPKSPWSSHMANCGSSFQTGLMGSLVRQEGHIYSLAASGDLLYTGSESKNIRVWKNQKELSAFKSKSGLVKAIVLSGDRIFSGHQDGKIRVWKVSTKDPRFYKRVGTLPTFKSRFKGSFNPSNQIQHTDAISSLCLSEDKSLLYSSSWDRTLKVWRASDFKCLESINAHNDAVNSIVAGFDGLIFTGSADGSVKVWRRQVVQGKRTKHVLSQTLLKQECAVTALAVDPSNKFLYCGSSDGLINFWVKKGKFLSHGGVLRSHNLAVLCLAAAGNLVFSGSTDTNICVWRREGEDHYCSSVLIGHGGPVKCLAVEEEKSAAMWECGHRQYIVYSGSIDKSVKIWRVVAPVDGEQTQTVENYSLWQRLTTVQSFSFPTQES